MADEIVTTQPAEAQQVVTDSVPAEVRQMMEISLNGGLPPEQSKNDVTKANQEIIETPTTETQEEIVDADDYAKSVGYSSWDEMRNDIPNLKKLKDSPTVAEIKYENEVSEKLAKALQAGKISEVYDYLDQQQRLEKLTTGEVTKDTADEIIKLGMRIRYKDEGLTEQEINYKFNKTYSIPKEPKFVDWDDEDEFKEKHDAWEETVADIEVSKIIDAKVAKKELEAAKAKLVIPEISTTIDEGYIQYQKNLEQSQQAAIENTTEYKKYTPKVLETKMNFTDEANKIAFEFQFEPDSESFAKVIDTICDNEKFEQAFTGQDGNFDRKKFAEVIYYGLNKEKFVIEAMNQAKNATMKQTLLADNSNRGMGNRQIPQTQEPSELDKQMQASLAPYQRN